MKNNNRIFFLFMGVMIFFSTGMMFVIKRVSSIIVVKQKELEKNQKMFLALNTWLRKKQQGKSIVNFLKENTYNSVAIYGLSSIGKLLTEELKGQVEIFYGIDKRNISAEYPVYKLEDTLPEVDAVIVTAIYDFDEIEEKLKKKMECPVYSIEDIVCFMS